MPDPGGLRRYREADGGDRLTQVGMKVCCQLSQLVTEDMISAPCGPGPQAHISAIRAHADAGFDDVYIGQAGPDQDGFFDFYAREALPRLRGG